ncbi:hypothetical protein HYALB_00009101 [Hymenoscyphus albidus]|uniref:Beta-mannosidase B n=1 Tax=Hymenoscyphus albidus TaxID=595503 RepID=A0A9N9LSN8_9HELO|nr:hypothetical protein HYALB_00009101 [Hymenoscyphus albidus]
MDKTGEMPTITPLLSNWSFKQGGLDSASEYLPANTLPTEIHRDLLKNNKIADPFLDLNELSVHWVTDEQWTYRTVFRSPSETPQSFKTVLVFEGLDTYASVYLNAQLILTSENMFLSHRVDVTEILTKNNDRSENILEIVFDSPKKRGMELIKEHPEHKFIVHQTDMSRAPVRKAQYHWGWDWGPRLLGCGIWKPIFLETYEVRIEDLWVEYELSEDLKSAKGTVFFRLDEDAEVVIELRKKGSGEQKEEIVMRCQNFGVSGLNKQSFEIPVKLWWPRGYGSKSLYTVTATLGSTSGHTLEKTFGFRKVELIQQADSIGTSFYFRINNVDIFAGGSCWIPADSFLTQISPERYRNWVKLAAEGNQIMLRIWGGGVYEHHAFYEACDEFGILVWQDFMFACANYPTYPELLKSVEEEVSQNARRLRHHPSIVIWAGNNEDYQIVERYGLEYRYKEDKEPESWLKTDFPARYIYEYLLPKVVSEEINGVPYHPSSPFGNGTSTVLKVDQTVGDVHQWNVWHGEMKPYQVLPQMGGRFVSEFGMEGYPHLETIQKCISKEEDRYPGSMATDFRNKAMGHERRLISYVAENFRVRYDLPSFTYLSQVMQADAMSWAYKSWRRNWGKKGGRKCGGVLVWQFNDCWPTISWAVVDHFLVPKPAYYAIKRAMAPVVIGVTRKFHDWTMRPADDLWKRDTGHIDMRPLREDIEFDVWVASNEQEKMDGKVVIRFISIRSGKEILPALEENTIVEPNGTTEIVRGKKIDLPVESGGVFDTTKPDPFIITAKLTVKNQDIATDISWPDPIKYLSFSDRGVEVKYSEDQSLVSISANKPVKGFVFSEKQGVELSDNGFDLVPGETREVTLKGKPSEELEWAHIRD